jgi:hypothetical protein
VVFLFSTSQEKKIPWHKQLPVIHSPMQEVTAYRFEIISSSSSICHNMSVIDTNIKTKWNTNNQNRPKILFIFFWLSDKWYIMFNTSYLLRFTTKE